MRDLKFRVIDRHKKIIAFEMFHISLGWHHTIVSELGEFGGEAPVHSGVYADDLENNFRECFTGLKDKNRKDIYEGDILQGDNSVWYVVDFDRGVFIGKVGGYFIGDKETHDQGYPLRDFEMISISIIGNIHENP